MDAQGPLALFSSLGGYWGFALSAAVVFYIIVGWFGKRHLSQGAKDSLSLWLLGAYESTWAKHFAELFDSFFGDRHLSWKCFFRSSIVSIASVLLLHFLFSKILRTFDARIETEISTVQALLIGVTINIIPDYISLFETRWLLGRFENLKSPIGHVLLLLVDLIFSSVIILAAIFAFSFVFVGETQSAIEIVSIFSFTSIFFYSTFFTSIWAWVYFISTMMMRAFSRTPLKSFLDVENKPVEQVGLFGAVLTAFGLILVTPLVSKDEESGVSRWDSFICSLFAAETCGHVARLAKDDTLAQEFLDRACAAGQLFFCGDGVTPITTYKDWIVVTENLGEDVICFTGTEASSISPNNTNRNNTFFIIASWQSGAATRQPSLYHGTNLETSMAPILTVGGLSINTYVSQNEAFIESEKDEALLIATMKNNLHMTIEATDSEGEFTATFSMRGIRKAIASINRLCR